MKKYSTNLKKANQWAPVFDGKLKQAKLDLAAAEQVLIHAHNEVEAEAEAALAQMNKALQDLAELQKVAFTKVFEQVFNHGYNRNRDSYEKQVAKLLPSIFQEGWLFCLKELETSNHLEWTAAAHLVELSDPPAVYSPLILLGFTE